MSNIDAVACVKKFFVFFFLKKYLVASSIAHGLKLLSGWGGYLVCLC